jgi:hypothetical protein
MNNPRTPQANILLRDGRRGIQEGGEEGEKEKERSRKNDEVESQKNPGMAEHDEECFSLKNLTTLFHCILLVFSFLLSLSCRTKEKQFGLFNILAANISK